METGQYETLWEKWDLFIPFIERSYKLLDPGGITSLIVSDAYCHSKYAQKSQEWFLRNSRILRLDFFSKIKIFDAAVHNITYFFQKADGAEWKPQRRVHDPEFGTVTGLPSDKQRNLNHRVFFPEEGVNVDFSKPVALLSQICYITKGMVVHADERVAQGAFEMDDLVSDHKDKLHPKPFVEGKHLDIWLPSTNKWLEWGTDRAPLSFSADPHFLKFILLTRRFSSSEVRDRTRNVVTIRNTFATRKVASGLSPGKVSPVYAISRLRSQPVIEEKSHQDPTCRREKSLRRSVSDFR